MLSRNSDVSPCTYFVTHVTALNENLARCFRTLPKCRDDRSAGTTSKQKCAVRERKNIIVTSDAWRVAIDLDTQVYEDAIAVRNDLTSVDKQRKEFTPVAELKQVGNLINTLALRLSNFQHLLPRLDRRRGL